MLIVVLVINFFVFIFFFFFFNDTATTEIYTVMNTLSLHDALPIFPARGALGPAAEKGRRCPQGFVPHRVPRPECHVPRGSHHGPGGGAAEPATGARRPEGDSPLRDLPGSGPTALAGGRTPSAGGRRDGSS